MPKIVRVEWRTYRNREALIKASIAFLDRWALDHGADEQAARRALRKVFRFYAPVVLERAIQQWQQRDKLKAA